MASSSVGDPKKNPFAVEFGQHSPESLNQNHGQRIQNMAIPVSEKSKENQFEVDYIPEKRSNMEDSTESVSSMRAVYNKLETASTVVTFVSDGSQHSQPRGGDEQRLNYVIDDPIPEALLAFLVPTFNICFSIGIAYWHHSQGLESQAYATMGIVFISAIVIQLAYAFNRRIKKAKIWDTSKVFAILTAIPITLSIFLSFADFVFAIKEAKDRTYVRPWRNTRMIYLVESLVLALPQCALQSVYLMEDPESMPKIKGLFVLFSLGVMTMGIAFARMRYDSVKRPDRFGSGVDKVVRSSIVWGNKGLWVTTLAILIVTARIMYPGNTSFIVVSIVALLVVYEVPVLLSSLNACRRCFSKISGIFFLLPQFVSLIVLIVWVNVDPTVYLTDVGICALGAFSWFESLAIIGWLLDGCSERDMDILPIYPHCFGDIYSTSTCCKSDGRN